jgi:hypothetical protein
MRELAVVCFLMHDIGKTRTNSKLPLHFASLPHAFELESSRSLTQIKAIYVHIYNVCAIFNL